MIMEYDFTRLVLFQQKLKLTQDDCEELDNILLDYMHHVNRKIKTLLDTLIAEKKQDIDDMKNLLQALNG